MANDYLPTLDSNFKFSPEVAAQIAGDSFLPPAYEASITGAYEIDPDDGPVQRLTVTGAVTLTVAALLVGLTAVVTVILVQDSAGHEVTMPTSADTVPVRWAQGVAPSPTADAGSRSIYYLMGTPGDGWDAFVSGEAMS